MPGLIDEGLNPLSRYFEMMMMVAENLGPARLTVALGLITELDQRWRGLGMSERGGLRMKQELSSKI